MASNSEILNEEVRVFSRFRAYGRDSDNNVRYTYLTKLLRVDNGQMIQVNYNSNLLSIHISSFPSNCTHSVHLDPIIARTSCNILIRVAIQPEIVAKMIIFFVLNASKEFANIKLLLHRIRKGAIERTPGRHDRIDMFLCIHHYIAATRYGVLDFAVLHRESRTIIRHCGTIVLIGETFFVRKWSTASRRDLLERPLGILVSLFEGWISL